MIKCSVLVLAKHAAPRRGAYIWRHLQHVDLLSCLHLNLVSVHVQCMCSICTYPGAFPLRGKQSLVKTKAWIDRLIDLIMSEPASAKEMSSKSHHPDVMCNRTQRILCWGVAKNCQAIPSRRDMTRLMHTNHVNIVNLCSAYTYIYISHEYVSILRDDA